LGKSGVIPKLTQDFIDVVRSGDPGRIQGFVNSALSEPWRERVLKINESSILKARCDLPAMHVPKTAIALTCGIDAQRSGFWFVVRAWARNWQSWLIHYGHVATWLELERLLFETWYPVAGDPERAMRIWRAAIDTGGTRFGDMDISMTEEAYYWIRQNKGRGCPIWGTKGSSRPLDVKARFGKPLDKTPSGKPLPGGIQIALLDTEKLKDLYHFRLNQAIEQGDTMPAYLHEETGDDYAKQITAEEKRIENGLQVWKQLRQDNHLFDAEVISMALAEPEWIGGGVNLLMPREDMSRRGRPRENKSRSGWIERKSKWLN
jgi:phage terminase large subunit GpA-like protein